MCLHMIILRHGDLAVYFAVMSVHATEALGHASLIRDRLQNNMTVHEIKMFAPYSRVMAEFYIVLPSFFVTTSQKHLSQNRETATTYDDDDEDDTIILL